MRIFDRLLTRKELVDTEKEVCLGQAGVRCKIKKSYKIGEKK